MVSFSQLDASASLPWGRMMFAVCYERVDQNASFVRRLLDKSVDAARRFRWLEKFEGDIRYLFAHRRGMDTDASLSHPTFLRRVKLSESEIAARLAVLQEVIALDPAFEPLYDNLYQMLHELQFLSEARVRDAMTLANPWLPKARFGELAQEMHGISGPLTTTHDGLKVRAVFSAVLSATYEVPAPAAD